MMIFRRKKNDNRAWFTNTLSEQDPNHLKSRRA